MVKTLGALLALVAGSAVHYTLAGIWVSQLWMAFNLWAVS